MEVAAPVRTPSLTARVRAYFEANPDEELDYRGIVAKFGCTLLMARKVVYQLSEVGAVESVHVIRRREKGIAK